MKLTDRQRRALQVFAGWGERVIRVALDEAEGLLALGLLRKDPNAWTGYAITDAGKAALKAPK